MRIGQKNEMADNRAELSMARLARDLLNESTANLPENITERLAKARKIAITHRKLEKKWVWQRELSLSIPSGFTSYNFGEKFWGTFGALPLFALILSLFLIVGWQNDERIRDIAEVDSALLIDIVPPEAYHDDGFIRFLMTEGQDLVSSTSDDKEGI